MGERGKSGTWNPEQDYTTGNDLIIDFRICNEL
jgi:hypothetical protein